MKNYLSLVLIILFSVLSCSKTSNPIEGTIDPAKEIKGQFSDWDSSYKDSLFWRAYSDTVEYVLTSTKISSTGSFNLALPVPPIETLRNYTIYESEGSAFKITDSVQFSEPDAKFLSLSLAHFQRVSMLVRCGDNNYFGKDSEIGNYQIHYYYFDRPCILTGYYKFEFKEGYEPEYDRYFLTKYKNVQFNKGWNQIIIELTDIGNETRIFEVSNSSRIETEWRFNALLNQFTRLP
jgi:hypothetical protein